MATQLEAQLEKVKKQKDEEVEALTTLAKNVQSAQEELLQRQGRVGLLNEQIAELESKVAGAKEKENK